MVERYPTVLTEQRLLPHSEDELAPWYTFDLLAGILPRTVQSAAGLSTLRPGRQDPAMWAEAERLLTRLGELIESARCYLAMR